MGKLGQTSTHACLIVIVSIILFPIYFIVTSAFKTTPLPELIPSGLTVNNFITLFTTHFPLWAVNTLLVCIGTVLLTLLLVAPAAYAFSRSRFWGRKGLLMFIIVAQMFPALLGMVAIFYILSALNMSNLLGLILVYAGGGAPFYTWFLKGYMDTIPRVVDEAALMDGASEFQIFRKIIWPLSRPAIGAISFMAFIFPYNDFILPSFLLTYPDTTLVAGLSTFAGIGGHAPNYPLLAAGVMLAAIPLLVVFLFFQRYLIAGLTRGIAK